MLLMPGLGACPSPRCDAQTPPPPARPRTPETREAEAEISRNANDAFQDMVNEHLEEICECL